MLSGQNVNYRYELRKIHQTLISHVNYKTIMTCHPGQTFLPEQTLSIVERPVYPCEWVVQELQQAK